MLQDDGYSLFFNVVFALVDHATVIDEVQVQSLRCVLRPDSSCFLFAPMHVDAF